MTSYSRKQSPLARLPADDEVARLRAVIEIQNELACAVSLDEIMAVAVKRAAELTHADASVVELPEGEEMVYRAVSGTASGNLGLRLKIASSLSGQCVIERRTLRCDDAETDDRVDRAAARSEGAISVLCAPLQDTQLTRGVLKVYADRAHAFGDLDVALLTQLSGVIVAHMRRAQEFERQAFESRQDVLTNMGNRRAYDERLAKEVARAKRYRHPLTLVLLDLDEFKAVNDHHGHPAGDEVLRRVGMAVGQTRLEDDGYRIGGDEFALILPNTSESDGRRVAERAAAEVARANSDYGVTASWGLAELTTDGPDDLHAKADSRLMAAKGERPSH